MVLEKLTFGEKIALERKEKKLSQRDLAKLLNVSAGSISGWEKHNRLPEKTNLLLLAKVFNKPVSYFTEESDSVSDDVFVDTLDDATLSLLVATDFIDGELIFLANKSGYITETVSLRNYDKDYEYFIWKDKSSAFVVKSCSEYIGGKMYLVYTDSELQLMDLLDDRVKDESENFRIIGKVIKNISDVE